MRKILDGFKHGLVGVDRIEEGAESLGMANKKIHFLLNLIKLKVDCHLQFLHAFSAVKCIFKNVDRWSLLRGHVMLQ